MNFHMLDLSYVESQEGEIVYGIDVHNLAVDSLPVVEDAGALKGSWARNMTVRQNIAVRTILAYFPSCLSFPAHPRSASTTKPVASPTDASLVSKANIWEKGIDTTLLLTFPIAFSLELSVILATIVGQYEDRGRGYEVAKRYRVVWES